MGRSSLLVSILALALIVAAPAASQDIESEKTRVDQRIAELQAEIDSANDREGVLTSQLSAVVDELQAAQSAVDEAQGSLDSLENELSRERLRLEKLTLRLQVQTRRLKRLQREYERAVDVLEQRVRVAYIDQPPDLLSFLVSVSSFSDLVDSYEFLSRIGAQDKRIAREVETAKKHAAAERSATVETRRLTAATVSVISARTEEARNVRDELAAGRDDLAAARTLKGTALAGARESREEYLAEVEALAAQSAALAERIRSAQTGSTSSGTGVSSSGLIWPVNGPVTSGFGMRWGRMHEGIDIAVPTGTPVWAAAAGTVIYSGWLGGYGNLVVVDHGNGLATAYAHNSALLVAVGQVVAQGDTIALAGSTGHSSGPHVHFEVRVNGVAVDPLLYL
jgi:murein DD-endopeptidase MepM/ murein hydrolase activator NlpD